MNALIRLRQQQQYQSERDEDEAHDKDLHQHLHLTLKDENNDCDYDDATTILKKNNIKANVTNTNGDDHDHDHYYDTMMKTSFMNYMDNDLYTPLAPEEANEDQLAEFFIGLDVSFLQQQQPDEGVREEEEQAMNTSMATTQEVPGVVVCHATKRRRLFLSFEDADSSSLSSLCSSSYSIDTDSDDDDDTDFVLHRKNRNLLQRE